MGKLLMIEQLDLTDEQEKVVKKELRGVKLHRDAILKVKPTGSFASDGEGIYQVVSDLDGYETFICYI